MKLNLIAFAVPLFVVLMLVEYAASRRRSRQLHDFSETIANLNVGISERLCDLLTTGAFYFVFSWIYRNLGLFDIRPDVFTWIAIFLATDLLWYWYHRAGHRVNLFWSAHVVHHQSDDFNYTVSARITIFQSVARGLFWCVLPLLGFPPAMITTLLLIHGTYPFFTHTQVVGKLGWLEYIFVTPSHHRVHHSSNPEYLDKNYGDVLIIWDKLFGTFAPEERAPAYGLTAPLKSHSFLWQHFHFIMEMAVAFKRSAGIPARLKVLFGRPDDIDPRIRPYLERKMDIGKKPAYLSPALVRNITIQTVLTLVVLFFSILLVNYLTSYQLLLVTVFLLLSVINTGAMLEQRRWVFYLDVFRLSAASLLTDTYFPNTNADTILFFVLMLVVFFHKALKRTYCNYLYPPEVFA